jgi:hypothetical protein
MRRLKYIAIAWFFALGSLALPAHAVKVFVLVYNGFILTEQWDPEVIAARGFPEPEIGHNVFDTDWRPVWVQQSPQYVYAALSELDQVVGATRGEVVFVVPPGLGENYLLRAAAGWPGFAYGKACHPMCHCCYLSVLISATESCRSCLFSRSDADFGEAMSLYGYQDSAYAMRWPWLGRMNAPENAVMAYRTSFLHTNAIFFRTRADAIAGRPTLLDREERSAAQTRFMRQMIARMPSGGTWDLTVTIAGYLDGADLARLHRTSAHPFAPIAAALRRAQARTAAPPLPGSPALAHLGDAGPPRETMSDDYYDAKEAAVRVHARRQQGSQAFKPFGPSGSP